MDPFIRVSQTCLGNVPSEPVMIDPNTTKHARLPYMLGDDTDLAAQGGEGLAFAFRTFRVKGYAPSLQILENPEGWNGPGSSDRDVQQNELPTDLAIIAF